MFLMIFCTIPTFKKSWFLRRNLIFDRIFQRRQPTRPCSLPWQVPPVVGSASWTCQRGLSARTEHCARTQRISGCQRRAQTRVSPDLRWSAWPGVRAWAQSGVTNQYSLRISAEIGGGGGREKRKRDRVAALVIMFVQWHQKGQSLYPQQLHQRYNCLRVLKLA